MYLRVVSASILALGVLGITGWLLFSTGCSGRYGGMPPVYNDIHCPNTEAKSVPREKGVITRNRGDAGEPVVEECHVYVGGAILCEASGKRRVIPASRLVAK